MDDQVHREKVHIWDKAATIAASIAAVAATGGAFVAFWYGNQQLQEAQLARQSMFEQVRLDKRIEVCATLVAAMSGLRLAVEKSGSIEGTTFVPHDVHSSLPRLEVGRRVDDLNRSYDDVVLAVAKANFLLGQEFGSLLNEISELSLELRGSGMHQYGYDFQDTYKGTDFQDTVTYSGIVDGADKKYDSASNNLRERCKELAMMKTEAGF